MKYDLLETGADAYSIIGYVIRAMRENNISKKEINSYIDKAVDAEYNKLIKLSEKIISKLNKNE